MKRFASVLILIALIFAVFIPSTAAQEGDIVDVAVANGNFTTLVAAVEAAGLVDTLKSEGPFTVFAPTDDAFAALPAGTLDTLLADPSGDLTQILLYHVVSGEVTSDQVVTMSSATTVNGADISISVQDGNVVLNDSVQVVMTDVQASNGVIHVIDAVLLPPSAEEEAPAPEALPDTGAEDGFSLVLLFGALLMGAGVALGIGSRRFATQKIN